MFLKLKKKIVVLENRTVVARFRDERIKGIVQLTKQLYEGLLGGDVTVNVS